MRRRNLIFLIDYKGGNHKKEEKMDYNGFYSQIQKKMKITYFFGNGDNF